MLRSLGNGRLRLRFAAVELAHGIGANKPRPNLGGFRLLAFAVGLLGRRADERVFNEHVSLLLAVCYAQHVPGTQLVTTLASLHRLRGPYAPALGNFPILHSRPTDASEMAGNR